MPNPEVIVIGAGAAGIGAGLKLTAIGVPHLILEAANRVGGRAHTDKSSLPYAWDRGCHWLHCADQNPLVAWADRLGAKISREVWEDYLMIWLGRGWVSEAEADDADQALDQAYEAIEAAAEAGEDRSLAAIIAEAPPSRWARQIHGVMQLLHSEDPDRVSAISAADYAETDLNWPVLSGYGDLIERMAAGLDVRLSTPVSAVRERPGGVVVETSSGTLEARAAIITASTNVLIGGGIEIGPGPARALLDDIATVPCGAYEKVAIALSEPLVDDPAKRFAKIDPGAPDRLIDFQIVQGPQPMMIAHLGGSRAREMVREGPEARMALARERLVQAFGAQAEAAILGMATTDWLTDPLIRGAYSASLPGEGRRRHAMIAAETGPIAFAGEAFSRQWQATAHGAYQSGRDVAARVAGTLR